jgi:hypothetical protein
MVKSNSVVGLGLLGLALVVSCRNGDKPVPILPTAPTADAGPEGPLDGGVDPVGPIAGGGRAARDDSSGGGF